MRRPRRPPPPEWWAGTSPSSPRATGSSPTSSSARTPPTGAGGGPSPSRAPPAPSSSPSTKRCSSRATTRCSPPNGCRGASGCGPVTSAPATCCPPRPMTCGWSRAGRARTRRRRTRWSPRRWPSWSRRRTRTSPTGSWCRYGAPSPRSPRSSACAGRGCCRGTGCTVRRTAGTRRSGRRPRWRRRQPASCVSCGFLVKVGGSLGQAFGVCANEFSPADGRLVSLSYGCGGHSEAAVMPKPLRGAAGARLDGLGRVRPAAGRGHRVGAGGGPSPGGPGPLLTGPAADGPLRRRSAGSGGRRRISACGGGRDDGLPGPGPWPRRGSGRPW